LKRLNSNFKASKKKNSKRATWTPGDQFDLSAYNALEKLETEESFDVATFSGLFGLEKQRGSKLAIDHVLQRHNKQASKKMT
jgi:hypothetical protein